MGRKFTELTAFIDGASSGNPGHAGAGVLFYDSSRTEVEALNAYLGETTNNVAEYQALILALEGARGLGANRLTVFSDSELLVKQFNGRYRVKNAGLKAFFERAKELQKEFEILEVRHVPREENQAADQLARQAAFSRVTSQDVKSPPAVPNKLLREALSLDEIALLPKWSDVLPAQVKTETEVVGGIRLGIPLLSAPVAASMPTSFAAAMAQKGGMAVLRPSRSPQTQVEAVRKIKANRRKDWGFGEADSGSVAPSRDDGGKLRVGALVHPSKDLLERSEVLVKAGADLVVLEASLGHGPELLKGIAQFKERFPEVPLIAGDVTDALGARQVLKTGADGVKVGAPFILGLKIPLFTAILDCAQAVQELGGTLVADVGTSELMVASGRIARAIGAGAHAAMATLQLSGKIGGVQIFAEALDNLVDDLRMIISCCGARTIEDLRQKARFIKARGGAEV